MFKGNIQKNKAFTLLFAVLVSSLVLAVGTSIINVALKQVRLSGNARDSQFAFYAANTGIECAIYWDLVGVNDGTPPVFATSTESDRIYNNDQRIGNVKCLSKSIIDDSNDCVSGIGNDTGWCIDAESDTKASSKFRISWPVNVVDYCADVIVIKEKNVNGSIDTIIESRGYNTCDTDIRRVERGLRMVY